MGVFPNLFISNFVNQTVCVCFVSDCVSHLGGFNQHGFLSTVECYCPERNEWTCVTDMPVGRSGMGVAVTMEPCPGSLPEQEDDEEDGAAMG